MDAGLVGIGLLQSGEQVLQLFLADVVRLLQEGLVLLDDVPCAERDQHGHRNGDEQETQRWHLVITDCGLGTADGGLGQSGRDCVVFITGVRIERDTVIFLRQPSSSCSLSLSLSGAFCLSVGRPFVVGRRCSSASKNQLFENLLR